MHQSIIQSSHWVMERPMWKLRQGWGIHNQIFNIRWAAKCQKLVPSPPPTRRRGAASSLGTSPERAENPTSLTVGSTRDVRRETNLGTCLPFEPPSSQRQYLVPDLCFRYLNVIVREKGWPRVDSEQSIAREFNYRNWPREDGFTRNISSPEYRDRCFSKKFFLFSCIIYNICLTVSFCMSCINRR